MRWILSVLLLPLVSAPGWAQTQSADRATGYAGGGGLISYYGQTGMFLNPTSGTKYAGDFSPQSCVLIFRVNGETVAAHALLATYGVRDWLEVGAFGLGVYGSPTGPGGLTAASSTMLAGQGNVRARLRKDEGGLPEVSVGGMFREGHGYLRQESLYLAASKAVSSVRFHAGFKQLWQDSSKKEANGSIAFGGIDFSLPHDLHLIGEVSTKDDVYARTPFSAGVQWRTPRGFGLSFGFVRSDHWGQDGAFAGIGINF